MADELTESQQAALDKSDPITDTPTNNGVSVASDFRNRLKKDVYHLGDGLSIEYRALLPIDFQTFRGSALSARMMEDGFTLNKTQDITHRERYAESLPRLVRSQLMIEAARDAIIHSAVNPKFSGLPPDECPANQVSIDELTPTEALVLNDKIYQLSGGDLAEDAFREAGQADGVEGSDEGDAVTTEEHADDSPDGKRV